MDTAASEGLRLQVLGPLTAWRDGAPVLLGSASQQAILGLLAVTPNASVHRDRISDALWGADPPPTAVTMIQSHVSRLRRSLDPGSPAHAPDGLLVSTATGYRLQVASHQLDLMVFLTRAKDARAARDAGDLTAAGQAYEQALSLWRGEPLPDIEVLRSHPAIIGLARQRDSVLIEFAEVAAQLGWHDRVLGPLEEFTSREPFNERAHACLMIALAGHGQRAAALEVFAQVGQRLADELGLRPGPELDAARQRVLRQQVTIAAPVPSADRAEDLPPVCQLPPAVADFTGRELEIAQLSELFQPEDGRLSVPVAVISGLPGAGKTTLALHVAHKIRSAFPDGQLWAQLDGAAPHPRNSRDVLGELLRALGLPGSAIPKTMAERASLYRSRLAGRRVLLLADDAASAAQVTPLLPGTGESAVLITSRTALSGPAGSRTMRLDPLSQAEAVQLLTRIVGQERVSAEPRAAHDLAAACGQLPLAVRIAGARLAARTSWQLSVLARKIAHERRRLDELEAGDMSVRASLAHSYRTLDEPARSAFRLLAMLGPADVAEWLIAALLGRTDAADVVSQLADKHLLTPVGTDATGQPRYRLHDLLRDYAAERLDQEGTPRQDAAMGRVMSGWFQLASRADANLPREPYFPPPPQIQPTAVVADKAASSLTADPMAWFTAERLNLLAAVRRCCAAGDHRTAAQLGTLMASFLHMQLRCDEVESIWQDVAAAAQRADDPAATAHARLRLAAVLGDQGRHAQAQPLVQQCVAAFAGLSDQRALGAAVYWRAACELNLGFFAIARQSATVALEIARQEQDVQTQTLALRLLAIAQATSPELREEALTSIGHALDLARMAGQLINEMEIMHSAAHVYNLTGRHQAALDICQRGLQRAREVGLPGREAEWLAILGETYDLLGRHREAAASLRAALPIFRTHLMHRFHALSLLKLGYAYQAMNNYLAAARRMEESLVIFDELQLSHYSQRAREGIASCRDHQRPPGGATGLTGRIPLTAAPREPR
jgi:DNA-binding SARP family transcriptional activator/tetratricopeptide (TPR) repeat protein